MGGGLRPPQAPPRATESALLAPFPAPATKCFLLKAPPEYHEGSQVDFRLKDF